MAHSDGQEAALDYPLNIAPLRHVTRDLRLPMRYFDGCIDLLLGILLIYNNGSWLFFQYRMLGLFALLGLIGTKIVRLSTQEKITRPNLLVAVLVAFPIMSTWMNSYEPLNIMSIGLNVVMYFMLSLLPLRQLHRIADRCAQVVLTLMMASVVFGMPFLVHYDWIRIIPTSTHPNFFGEFYNFLIYADRINNDFRVQSVFWEPGAWVFQMAFCLYWTVTVKKRWKWYPLFLAAFALALSTTGFILLAIHYCASLFTIRRMRLAVGLMLGPPLIVIVLVASLPLVDKVTGLPMSEFAKEMVVGKFTGGKYAHSMDERAESSNKAAMIALENPFFGIGKQAEERMLFVTSSIFEYMYQFGLFFLGFFLFVVWRFYSHMTFPFSIAYMLIWLNGEALASGTLCSLVLVIGAKMRLTHSGIAVPGRLPGSTPVAEGK